MEALFQGLRAIGEDSRLRLLHLLAQGELNVTEITLILGQSQPRISRHLKLMCDAGLLDRYREGSWVPPPCTSSEHHPDHRTGSNDNRSGVSLWTP